MKHWKLLLGIVLCLVLVTAALQPLRAEAAEAVTVYLDPASGDDTADGLTEDTAVKSYDTAYDKVKTAGSGTIVMLSTLTITEDMRLPSSAATVPVVLTSKTGAEGISATTNVRFNAPTTLQNITMTLTKASTTCAIFGEGKKLTVGENVTSVGTDGCYFSLTGGGRWGSVSSTDLTVQSGTWRNIYVGTYGYSGKAKVTGDAKLTMTGGTLTGFITPAYGNSATIGGNVDISLSNMQAATIYGCPAYTATVSGDVNITLGEGAVITGSVYTGGLGSGSITGALNLIVDGADTTGYDKIKNGGGSNYTGTVGSANVTLKSGVVTNTIADFDNVAVDIPEGKTLTINKYSVTADTVQSAGTLVFKSTGKLTAAAVTGTVNCAIDGFRFNNHAYITAPAGSGFVFADNAVPEENGTWIVKDMENFHGLVLTAEEGVTVTLYTGFDPESSSVKKVEPYATEGNTQYYPALQGKYYYRASGTGYYKVKRNIYMSEEKTMTKTLMDVTPGKLSGLGWEPDNETVKYYTDEFFENAIPSSQEYWSDYADLFTTPAFGEDRAEHQHTTQQEMEDFLKNLDTADDNMYIYSMGTSGREQDMPLVIFTRVDLTGKTLEEAAALIVADSEQTGKLTVHHQAHIHGNEQAAGEAALGMIQRLDGAYGESLLDSLNIYVMPRMNPDGAEDNLRRIPTWGLKDPNNDWIQLETKEVQNAARVMDLFKPHVVLDNHESNVTTTADTERYMGMLVNPRFGVMNGEEFKNLGITMTQKAFDALEAENITYRYISNTVNGKGMATVLGYAGNQGILAFLMESPGILHGTVNYERRVVGSVICMTTFYDYLKENLAEAKAIIVAEQQQIVEKGKTFEQTDTIELETTTTEHPELAWTIPTYDGATGLLKEYQTTVPGVYDDVLRSRTRPTAYVLPAGEDWVADVITIMDRHGIQYTRLPAGAAANLRQYTGTYEEAALTEEMAVTFPNGAYVFTMDTQKAMVLATLLEPDMTNTARRLTNGSGYYTATEGGDNHTYIAAVDGVFPIYRYEHDLNIQGMIDYTVLADAPEGLQSVGATKIGGTGSITGLDAEKLYEYRAESETEYTAVAAGATEITGLQVGKYYVRFAATAETAASADAVVEIGYGVLDEYAVYLDSVGGAADNDGYTQATAVNTIDLAYSQLTALMESAPAGTTGKIVIIGTYTQDGERHLPSHDYPLLITGGNFIFKETSPAGDYRYLGIGGDTTFDDITISVGSATDAYWLFAMGHKLTIGEKVVCVPFVDSADGSNHYFSISGGKNGGGTVANTDITVKGGRFTSVYAADYTGVVTTQAKAVLSNCRVYRFAVSDIGTTKGDVYMEARNVTIGQELHGGNRRRGNVAGDVTIVLGEGVTALNDLIYAGSRDAGNVAGTVTVIADGIDLTANTIHGSAKGTGTIGGLKLVVNKGELADVADTFVTRDGVDIVLGCDQTEAATLNYSCNLDLGGCDATITVADGKTLTVCDTATDDFKVLDEQGYGILTATGTTAAKEGYVVREETNGKSYHRRELKLDSIVLRPAAAGIYYTGQFGLNELYRDNVESYGVVLSLNPEPELGKEGCKHSTLTQWPESGAGYGTVLQNIMTKDGGYTSNKANANMTVYGVAYVKYTDGTVEYSNSASYTLKQVVEASDAMWAKLDEDQKNGLLAMYQDFSNVMKAWTIPNIKAAA